MDWSYFNKFEEITDKYLPPIGEGDNMAQQIVTAVCKLVYKWYNDGDVFDNTRYLTGWCNNLSSYANWLYKYAPAAMLEGVWDCRLDSDYEELLADLADSLLDEDFLKAMEKREKTGSIYRCEGPFHFEERYDDEEEDW